jgi:polyisoprenoid-binding protein YceI
VIGSINTQTGDVAFEAAVKNFSFSNPKMQEHFNGENWFNSDKFPVITFKGKISKINAVKFNRNGVYKVTVTGEMKIKDVARQEKINGTITVKDGKFSIASSFKVKLANYNISGMPVEAGKVSREPKVSVSAQF